MSNADIPIFILAWERPIYLWVTLDSFFRLSPPNARFTIINNNSTHPMVRQVIQGFERRGMFDEVIHCDENSPTRFRDLIGERHERLPEFFGYVEGDVELLKGNCVWLDEMLDIMGANPDLAYLGSLIDPSDFVPLEAGARLGSKIPIGRLEALLKAHSPERSYIDRVQGRYQLGLQPPGRLTLFRKSAFQTVRITCDGVMTKDLCAQGWQVGIATNVRHRHLSLLHIFDEPGYDVDARNEFVNRMID